jgi:microcystin-dependent protein
MSQPFVGQVIAVGFNFAPVGWLPCDGRLLSIAQYDVLFNLVGTTYGGDGQTTFAVPDLRGRVVIGQGNGAGLSPYVMGQMAGTSQVTVTTPAMPAHVHTPMAAADATAPNPSNTVVLGATGGVLNVYASTASPVALNPGVIGLAAGSSLPHDNMQPYQTINYIIAFEGIYPSQ